MQAMNVNKVETLQTPARELLAVLENNLGFVPNIFAVMAGSVPALKAFFELNAQFAESGFDAMSREVIQTAASVENQCTYCVAGHTAFAEMQDVPRQVIDAVRNNRAIADTRLEALNQFTRLLVRERGMVSADQVQDFLDAGYEPAQVLEVILGICVKTFSNLANNVMAIPLDDEFTPHAWQPNRCRELA